MNLPKLLASLAMLAVSAIGFSAEKADTISLRRAFIDFPSPALDLLTRSMRLDMLDYYEADSIYRAKNALEGLSSLDTVATDYLRLRITPASTLQLKLLPLKKGGEIVMAIYTAGGEGQAADSEIRFYDASLTELPRDRHMKYPRLKDFFSIPKGSETTQKEIDSMVPFPTVEFTAFPGETSLKAVLTVGEYINQDDYNILKLFLKPDIRLEWNGRKFE